MIKKYCRSSSVPDKRSGKIFNASIAMLVGLTGASCANAGQTFQMGPDQSLTLGFGLRTSYTSLQNGAPDGVSRSNDFSLDSSRLYINGQLNNMIKGTFNTERDSTGKIVLMDGITQFEFSSDFNLWAGRLLPPSDRSNLDGPYYINAWSYPGVVSNYPNVAIGRDNGAVIWGKPMDGKLVYSFGAFGGHNAYAGGSDASDDLLYAGRLAINFLDPEPAPAYYNGSTYYGSKNILTLGLVFQNQKNGVGNSAAARGDYNAWNADILFEEKVSGEGVVTVEGAYYKYGLGAVDCNSGEPGSMACTGGTENVGGQVAGKAYLATLEYMFPEKVGVGNFQPFVRVQNFKRDLSQTTNKQSDIGVNYVISGPNARLSAVYSKLSDNRLTAALADTNQFIVGFQFQY
jgi:hypothetical protein